MLWMCNCIGLLAEAVDPIDSTALLVGHGTNLVALGCLIWVVKTTVGTSLPKAQEQSNALIEKIIGRHDQVSEKMRNDFINEIKESRDQFSSQMEAQRRQCADEAAAIDRRWEAFLKTHTVGKEKP